MSVRYVVTAVIEYDGKILLMKRSPYKDEQPGKWENPGGGIEEGENVETACVREVREETGLTGRIIRSGQEFDVHLRTGTVHIYPVLFKADTNDVRLSHEHVDYTWIDPKDFVNYDCVNDTESDFKNLGMI